MKSLLRLPWSLCVALATSGSPAFGADVSSPDGRTVVTVDVDRNGAPRYAVRHAGAEIMPAGFLGMRFQSQPAFDEGFRVAGTATSSHDQACDMGCG